MNSSRNNARANGNQTKRTSATSTAKGTSPGRRRHVLSAKASPKSRYARDVLKRRLLAGEDMPPEAEVLCACEIADAAATEWAVSRRGRVVGSWFSHDRVVKRVWSEAWKLSTGRNEAPPAYDLVTAVVRCACALKGRGDWNEAWRWTLAFSAGSPGDEPYTWLDHGWKDLGAVLQAKERFGDRSSLIRYMMKHNLSEADCQKSGFAWPTDKKHRGAAYSGQ